MDERCACGAFETKIILVVSGWVWPIHVFLARTALISVSVDEQMKATSSLPSLSGNTT